MYSCLWSVSLLYLSCLLVYLLVLFDCLCVVCLWSMSSLYWICTCRLSWPGLPGRRDILSQWDLPGQIKVKQTIKAIWAIPFTWGNVSWPRLDGLRYCPLLRRNSTNMTNQLAGIGETERRVFTLSQCVCTCACCLPLPFANNAVQETCQDRAQTAGLAALSDSDYHTQ